MEELNKISAMEMFIAFRKGIQELIKEKPKATAQDVLDGLELTRDILDLMLKKLKK